MSQSSLFIIYFIYTRKIFVPKQSPQKWIKMKIKENKNIKLITVFIFFFHKTKRISFLNLVSCRFIIKINILLK